MNANEKLEYDFTRLLNAGFKLELQSDGNTFTAVMIDHDDKLEDSNISFPRLISGLVELAILDCKAEIVNAEHKLKFLDPDNEKKWKK